MNRGSESGLALQHQREAGFNEAPIHESGKCASRTRSPIRNPSFNEAPIHESGKFSEPPEATGSDRASMRPRFMNRGSHEHGRQSGRGGGASMRPRFMNRGSTAARGHRPRETSRFNEAPIHESGKSGRFRSFPVD